MDHRAYSVFETKFLLTILGAFLFLGAACIDKGDGNQSGTSDGIEEKTVPISARALVAHQLPPSTKLRGELNGLINPRSWRFRAQSHTHPGLDELREREGLLAVVASGSDEFEKMLLLCDWVNNQWESKDPTIYPPWDANQILSMIRSGKTNGCCPQYAVLFVQSCLALGWQARYIDLCPRGKKPGSGHFSVEVWSNQHNRWIVLDPFFDCRFEREGMPVSALEIHEALVRGVPESVKVIRGQGKHGRTNSTASDKRIVEYFYHLAVDMRNDHLQNPFHFWDRRDTYVSWKDQFTDGMPEIFRHFSSDPLDFNFPFNQVMVKLKSGHAHNSLTCLIRTNMPGAETLEIRHGEGPWVRPPSPYNLSEGRTSILGTALSQPHGSVITYQWKLEPGSNKIFVRALNRLGVTGPSTFLWVDYKPQENQTP